MGQMRLLNRARDNKKVLKDVRVSERAKEKIQKIQKYKEYFYKYFEKEPQNIYNKTMLLDQAAVTYLVIASPYNELVAKEECFPFMGCFPYLGFFKKESALRYERKLKEQDYSTWLRPVYAYSTLGHFNDPILSSFFYYNDYDLADLIFHELFHTIFFIKNEVTLNENLASFFAEKMVDDYFSFGAAELKKRRQKRAQEKKVRNFITKMAKSLQKKYNQKSFASKEKAQDYLEAFLQKDFLPAFEKLCHHPLAKKTCSSLKGEWNNARFAAYLTYTDSLKDLEDLYEKQSSLKDFLTSLEQKYTAYKKTEHKIIFSDYLLGEK